MHTFSDFLRRTRTYGRISLKFGMPMYILTTFRTGQILVMIDDFPIFCHMPIPGLHVSLTGSWWLRGATAIRSLDLLDHNTILSWENCKLAWKPLLTSNLQQNMSNSEVSSQYCAYWWPRTDCWKQGNLQPSWWPSLGPVHCLIHWGRDKRLPFCRQNFEFSSIKMIALWLKFHRHLLPEGPINNKSSLVQVMAWHCVAPSHYLNLWWPSLLHSAYRWLSARLQ